MLGVLGLNILQFSFLFFLFVNLITLLPHYVDGALVLSGNADWLFSECKVKN